MWRFIVRRLLQIVLVFLGVTLLIYLAVYSLPGDPIRAMAGDRPLSPSTVAALRERLRLDDPVFVRYFEYLGGLLRGDFGTDFNDRSVAQQMGARWPVTIQLAMTAWVIEVIAGIAFGVVAAMRRGKTADHATLFVSIAVISVPAFVISYTAQLLLGVRAGIFPVSGISEGWPASYLLPGLVLAAFGMASVARLVRASVLENLRADYVRTAYSKGLSTSQVMTRHVLRNSLISAVTFLAIDLGALLGGAVVVEGIFNLPGIGQLLFRSVATHDGPVVVGVATALVMVFLLANLVVDMLYGVLDPRIRHE